MTAEESLSTSSGSRGGNGDTDRERSRDSLDQFLEFREIATGGSSFIEILENPSQFYETLREMISKAKHRIILSALYLGAGDLEQQLLEDLHRALDSSQSLKIDLIFDHSRAQRGPHSSLDLLLPLLRQYPDQISVNLYQMPILRRFPYSLLPGQLKEVAAVYHCKFCLCDDSVILTGANLAAEYFSTRQDRYWLIDERQLRSRERGEGLVTFLEEFSEIVKKDCFLLLPQGNLLQPSSSLVLSSMRERLLQLLAKRSSVSAERGETQSLRCFPLLQHRSLDLRGEEDVLVSLFSRISRSLCLSPSVVRLSTPYTNFSSLLSEQILETCLSGQRVEILGPDDSSHGFASGKGFKGLIPAMHLEAFTSAMSSAYQKIQSRLSSHNTSTGSGHSNSHLTNNSNTSDRLGGSQQYEYFYEQLEHYTFKKSGWTFHAKGFWFDLPFPSPNTNAKREKEEDRLLGSYIGSSNFGERSWTRDFELGFLFLHSPTNPSSSPNSSHSLRTSPNTSSRTSIRSEEQQTALAVKALLDKDFLLLRRHCLKDEALNQKIAAITLKNKRSGLSNNLLSLGNLRCFFHQRMIALLTRFIKSYL